MSRPMHRRDFLRSAGAAAAALAAAGPAAGQEPAAPGSSSDAPRKTVTEPRRTLPVLGAYDVVVVGGGIAGVAAAVAAARNGAKACLLEKACALGGLATLGNVIVYLPICDGRGNQVIGGLGEELLKRSVRDGFAKIPACWAEGGDPTQRTKHRYKVSFNPASCMLELEELVVAGGVALYYDTRFCDVVKEGGLVSAVLIENKSGRSALACRTVVDASGDADVCARAGEETVSLRTNVAAGWFYSYDGKRIRLNTLSRPFGRDPRKAPREGRGYAGDDGADVTAQILAARQMTRKRLQTLRSDRGTKAIYPVILPTIADLRMTRRLKGRVALKIDDDKRWFDDAVGMTGDWRKAGPIYYLPLACLAGVKTDNLLAAGRCISALGPCWDVTRVIPTCAVTGEAAGTAAALAARKTGGRVSKLDVRALQDQLRKQKVLIDRKYAAV